MPFLVGNYYQLTQCFKYKFPRIQLWSLSPDPPCSRTLNRVRQNPLSPPIRETWLNIMNSSSWSQLTLFLLNKRKTYGFLADSVPREKAPSALHGRRRASASCNLIDTGKISQRATATALERRRPARRDRRARRLRVRVEPARVPDGLDGRRTLLRCFGAPISKRHDILMLQQFHLLLDETDLLLKAFAPAISVRAHLLNNKGHSLVKKKSEHVWQKPVKHQFTFLCFYVTNELFFIIIYRRQRTYCRRAGQEFFLSLSSKGDKQKDNNWIMI